MNWEQCWEYVIPSNYRGMWVASWREVGLRIKPCRITKRETFNQTELDGLFDPSCHPSSDGRWRRQLGRNVTDLTGLISLCSQGPVPEPRNALRAKWSRAKINKTFQKKKKTVRRKTGALEHKEGGNDGGMGGWGGGWWGEQNQRFEKQMCMLPLWPPHSGSVWLRTQDRRELTSVKKALPSVEWGTVPVLLIKLLMTLFAQTHSMLRTIFTTLPTVDFPQSWQNSDPKSFCFWTDCEVNPILEL